MAHADESIFVLIEEEEIEAVESLINSGKVDVNEVDEDGYSPLILATSIGLHDITEVLLAAKADIDYVAEDGASPIFCAVQEGHWDVVELLIDKDADVNTQLNKGPTPLYIAAQEGYKSLVSKLIKHKANVNKRAHGITPLFIACQERHVGVTRSLINGKADPNRRNKSGGLPLAVATWKGHVPIVRVLVENSNVKLDKISMGVTPLMNAVKNKSLEMVQVLVEAKANVNTVSQTNAKTTCALMAAEANCVDILQYLKDNGADLKRKNIDGLMPADILISKYDVIFDGPRGSVTVSANASAPPEKEKRVKTPPKAPPPEPAPASDAPKAFQEEPVEEDPLSASDSSDFEEARKMRKKKRKRKKRKKKRKKKKRRNKPEDDDNIIDSKSGLAKIDKLLSTQDMTRSKAKALFEEHDVMESGYLGLPEFMAVMTELGMKEKFPGKAFKKKVKECFKRFDDNNDKRIDFQEFVMFFNWFQKQACGEGSEASDEAEHPSSPHRSAKKGHSLLEYFILEKDALLGFGIKFRILQFDRATARGIHHRIQPERSYLVVEECRDAPDRIGPATLQGVQPDDILIKCNKVKITSFASFAQCCKGHKEIHLEMIRPAKPLSETLAPSSGMAAPDPDLADKGRDLFTAIMGAGERRDRTIARSYTIDAGKTKSIEHLPSIYN